MRVTMLFICILLNLHVKEARRNKAGYLRRLVFPALSYGVSSRNIATRCRDKWTSIRPLRSRRLSTLFPPRWIRCFKGKRLFRKLRKLSLSPFRDFGAEKVRRIPKPAKRAWNRWARDVGSPCVTCLPFRCSAFVRVDAISSKSRNFITVSLRLIMY